MCSISQLNNIVDVTSYMRKLCDCAYFSQEQYSVRFQVIFAIHTQERLHLYIIHFTVH